MKLLSDASLNDLGERGRSASTRGVYARAREFLAAAAKELAERERVELAHRIEFHQTRHEDEGEPDAQRAGDRKVVTELTKVRDRAATDILAIQGGPAGKANPCTTVPRGVLRPARSSDQRVLHTCPVSPNPRACFVASVRSNSRPST